MRAPRLVPFALAAAALALLSGCGPREIEPRILDYFTEEVVRRHDEYKVPLRLNLLWDMVLYLGFMAVLLRGKLNLRLKQACERVGARWGEKLGRVGLLARVGAVFTRLWGDTTWSGALLFAVAFLAIQTGLNLPTAWYFTWYYAHLHGTSVEPIGRWAYDLSKAFASESFFLALLAFGLYGLARRRRNWWLLLGIPSAIGITTLGGMLDPLNAQLYFEHTKVPEGPLKAGIVDVLKKAKVEYEDVYLEKHRDVSRRADAYIAGEGPTRRIVLWDNTTTLLTADEVALAIAHELGHLQDRSPSRPIFAGLAILPLLFGLAWSLRKLGATGKFGFEDDRDIASLPMVLLLFWLLGTLTDPLANAYSRHLERRADRYALELVPKPEAFRSMMVKLSRNNLADVHPPAWIRYLLASHPAVMDRIDAAEAFAREKGIALPRPKPEDFPIPPELDPLVASRVKKGG